MTRFIKKLTAFMLVFVLVGAFFTTDTVAAGGLSISSSASEVSEGGTFTVTVKAASDYFVAGISLGVSGGTVVSGLGKSSLDSGESTTAKIKLTGDSCKVTVTGTAANYTTETEGTASASVTVKKKAPATTEKKEETTTTKKEETTTTKKEETTTKKEETSTTKKEETSTAQDKSNNNNLSSITISEGTLTPAFSSGVTDYKVNLLGTVTKVTLSAKASDSKAVVSGTGEKELKPGDNKFSIVCKAENGSQKTYTVNVYVDEAPLVYTTYQDQKLGVVRDLKNIGIPATFEETKVTLEDTEIPAFHSNQYNLTLVYLANEAGAGDFYIYDSEQGIISGFRPVAILGRNVVLYDLTEEEQSRENMLYKNLTIDGVSLNGWVYETEGYEDYAYIPVINEVGEKVIYEYEKTENTLQLYKEYAAPDVLEKEAATIDIQYFYIAAGAAGVLLLTTAGLLIYSLQLKKKK